mgnify:CR=1 FL=1
MQYDKSKEIKVGIVTFVAILLFIVGMTLGRGYRISVDPTELNIRFPNSGGISPSAPVLINGVERGSVNSINPDNGSVLIKISLDDISDLNSDASARISMLEITGGKKIDIFPGKSPQPIDPDEVIPGKTSPDLGELISVTGEMIIETGIPMFRRIDSILNRFGQMMAGDTLLEKIVYTIDNAYLITESTKDLIAGREKDLQETITNLRDISRQLKTEINDKSPKIDTLISELQITVNTANGLLSNADSSVYKLDMMLDNLNSLLDDVQNGEGLVSKLIYDKDFASELDSTFISIKQLVEKINEYGINTNVRLGSRP